MASQELILSGSELVGALSKAEIDMQVSTAKAYPRDIPACCQEALQMATIDSDTAGTMFYVIPRGGKKIEGPSIRLAEIMGYCWQNLRYDSKVASIDHKFVTAQGSAFDIERNLAARVEAKRRITDNKGRRYNDDMIQVTANAACSIALREAIFKVVPRTVVNSIWLQCKKASIGKTMSFSEQVGKCLAHFGRMGVTEDVIATYLKIDDVQTMNDDDLIELRGIANAIKDGDVTVETAFGLSKKRAKRSDLNDQLADDNQETTDLWPEDETDDVPISDRQDD